MTALPTSACSPAPWLEPKQSLIDVSPARRTSPGAARRARRYAPVGERQATGVAVVLADPHPAASGARATAIRRPVRRTVTHATWVALATIDPARGLRLAESAAHGLTPPGRPAAVVPRHRGADPRALARAAGL